MTYNQFLFSQLLRDLTYSANEKEYDLLFELSNYLYDNFENSEENKQDKSEYECIVDYICNNKEYLEIIIRNN
jgi:transcription termination factor NusB